MRQFKVEDLKDLFVRCDDLEFFPEYECSHFIF